MYTHACNAPSTHPLVPEHAQGLFDMGYGVVLDSGTTYTHLPREAYDAFVRLLLQYTNTSGLPRIDGPDPNVCDMRGGWVVYGGGGGGGVCIYSVHTQLWYIYSVRTQLWYILPPPTHPHSLAPRTYAGRVPPLNITWSASQTYSPPCNSTWVTSRCIWDL